MGRESRLAKRAGPIGNRGDLDRVEAVATHFLNLLKVDDRVVAQYTAWCYGRELPRLMTVPVSDSLPDLKAAAMDDLMNAVMRDPSDAEMATVLQVLEGIGPSRRWPRRWAMKVLLNQVWPSIFYTAIQHPAFTQPLWMTVRDDGRIKITYGPDDHQDELEAGGRWVMKRRGHRPQAKGHEALREGTQWWYQACLQDPPVPRPELTKKYAEREKRLTDPHSVVDDRIEQAETLLNRVLDA